jgi:hypothetical protein
MFGNADPVSREIVRTRIPAPGFVPSVTAEAPFDAGATGDRLTSVAPDSWVPGARSDVDAAASPPELRTEATTAGSAGNRLRVEAVQAVTAASAKARAKITVVRISIFRFP